MSDLDALWAAAKVRGVFWRAQAVLDAMQRIEAQAAVARPPVKTVQRPAPRRGGAR